jgi:hypothetical protein
LLQIGGKMGKIEERGGRRNGRGRREKILIII